MGLFTDIAKAGVAFGFDRLAARDNQKLQKQYFDYTTDRQEKRQDYLLKNSALLEKTNLMNAGLSPNNMMGNGAQDFAAPTGLQGSGSANYSDVVGTMMQSQLMSAQIENLKQQTKKTEAETEGQTHTNRILESDAAFRDAYNTGVIDTQYSTIQMNQFKNSLTQVEIAQAREQTKLIEESCKQMSALADIAQSEAQIKKIEAAFADKKVNAEISEILSRVDLNSQQFKNLLLEGKNIELQGNQISLQNARLVFDLASDKEFKEMERSAGVLGKAAEIVLRALK